MSENEFSLQAKTEENKYLSKTEQQNFLQEINYEQDATINLSNLF